MPGLPQPPADAPGPAPPRPQGRLASLRHRDHTRGSLPTSLAVLAFPLLATSLATAVFQIVDLAFVSRIGEDATTAVVVTNQSLRQMVFMCVMGASFGAQGLISRCVGEGVPETAERVAGQLVLLGGIFSGVVALVGGVWPEPLLAAMNVAPNVLAVGVPYVRWTFLLNFGFVFVLLASAILNGAGDSATPFAVSLVQIAVALAAEWCLIFGRLGLPALGVEGVALGLAAGQALALVLLARVLLRGASRVHVRWRHLGPDPALLRRILRLAWPPALQMIGGFLVTVVFLRLMGSFGEKAQAGYSIGLRLAMVGPMLAFPVAGACATLVGQSLGASDVPRARRALRVGLVCHATLLGSLALGMALLRREILGAFSDDPAVVDLGSEFLAFQAGIFGAWAFFFVFLRTLQAAGDVRVPMLLSISNSVLVTIPLGFALASERGLGWGPRGVFVASLVGAITVTLATGGWLATGRWTRGRGLSTPPGG